MKRLLVVDDDPFVIKMMEDLFRQDWKILGETVKERIKQNYSSNPPNVILLNVALRRTDGEPTFDAIREALPATPVIVYSPANMAKLGRDLVKRGAFWNLVTPLNTMDLEHVMNMALRIEEHQQLAKNTNREFASLEEGIARLSLPLHGSLPERFTFEQDELTQGIVELLADALEVERVSLMLLDQDAGELRIKAAKGLHPSVIRNTVKKIGDGIAGWVAREGKPLFIRDVERSEQFSESPFYDQLTTKSLICVPLKAGDRVVGVLNANNKSSGLAFEEYDLYLATIFSHILLMTLQNAQSHYEREKMLEREVQFGELYRKISGLTDLGTLFKSVLSDCCQIFDADGGAFFLLDEKESSLTAYCWAGEPLTTSELPPPLLKSWQGTRNVAAVWNDSECKKYVLLPGVVKNAQSWITVPILFQNRRIGSLEMGSVTEQKFRAQDLRPLALAGQQAAMGINNARLYEKLLVSIKEISEARKEVDRIRRNQFL